MTRDIQRILLTVLAGCTLCPAQINIRPTPSIKATTGKSEGAGGVGECPALLLSSPQTKRSGWFRFSLPTGAGQPTGQELQGCASYLRRELDKFQRLRSLVKEKAKTAADARKEFFALELIATGVAKGSGLIGCNGIVEQLQQLPSIRGEPRLRSEEGFSGAAAGFKELKRSGRSQTRLNDIRGHAKLDQDYCAIRRPIEQG